MSSSYDEVLQNRQTELERSGAPSGTTDVELCGLMPGAKYFVAYPEPYPAYEYGDNLTDNNTTWNTDEKHSDNNGGTWVYVANSEHSNYTMYEAILYSSW